MRKKRGQVTIFIIIAVVIVAVVLGYFLLRGKVISAGIPASLKPVEDYFLACVQEQARVGISLMGDHAGYIYLPDFEPGSEYMPSSNQLGFMGSAIPYWYYVSGNNIVKEQAPSKNDMEKQLNRYLEENLDCDFSSFRQQGFLINVSNIKAAVTISDANVQINIVSNLDVSFENESARISEHKTAVESKLGKFYSLAQNIYNKEKNEMFLENYAVDVLYNYAPVNGVEISCAPKVWMKSDVDNELKNALEANMQAINFNGEGYFSQSLNIAEQTSFIYFKDWPTRIEVWDSNNGVMLADPVGNQAGLGILGFCYVPYHFVYDLVYPVLIRVYDDKEAFQFPVVVLIEGNKARKALSSNVSDYSEPELCKYKNSELSVYTYDTNLEPIEADIGFNCLSEECDIGSTKIDEKGDAILSATFPKCINGYIEASAEGYADKKVLFSTNEEGVVNIVLDKLYNLNVGLKIDSRESEDYAIITFDSEDNSKTIAYPQQKSVSLSEGYYNVSVYVYRNSSINIPGTNKQICNEVPKSGLLGLFGATEEKCFNVNLPAQTLTNVIVGGGKSQEYIIKGQLEKGNVEINVDSFPIPSSLENLQDAYNLLNVKSVNLEFK